LEAWAVDDFTLKPDDITTDLPKLIEIVRKGLDSNSASIRINAAGALSAMTREPSTRAIMREAGLVDVLRTMALSGNSCVRLEACINALASLAIGDTS
jgi:HEAT repeat protein